MKIESLKHKGLKRFFDTGSKQGIQAEHADKLNRQLTVLDQANYASDLNLPGWHLHSLKGDLNNHWSIKVNGNWRLVFTVEHGDVLLLDYLDYH